MLGKLIRLMLEYRSGPLTILQEGLSPRQNDITLSETNYNDPQSGVQLPETKTYVPMKTCTSCGGTGEDSSRYEPLFDVYAPCETCHGAKEVPLDGDGSQVTS